MLGGLTIYLRVANFLQCIRAKNYENWLAVDKVIAKIIRLTFFGPPCISCWEIMPCNKSHHQVCDDSIKSTVIKLVQCKLTKTKPWTTSLTKTTHHTTEKLAWHLVYLTSLDTCWFTTGTHKTTRNQWGNQQWTIFFQSTPGPPQPGLKATMCHTTEISERVGRVPSNSSFCPPFLPPIPSFSTISTLRLLKMQLSSSEGCKLPSRVGAKSWLPIHLCARKSRLVTRITHTKHYGELLVSDCRPTATLRSP